MPNSLWVPRFVGHAAWIAAVTACFVGLQHNIFSVRSVQAESSAERRGREAFATRGCAHCHGDHRQGTDRAPELLTVRKRLNRDAVETQIRDGGQMMPAFGKDLSPDELKDLVAYVRDKHEPTSPSVATP
jgi:mono/diheme cytochrome c family protein